MQYVDALRLGDVARFKSIEAESGDWWFASLDRGAGAALHFAADHGQVTSSVSCRFKSVDDVSHQGMETLLHGLAVLSFYVLRAEGAGCRPASSNVTHTSCCHHVQKRLCFR